MPARPSGLEMRNTGNGPAEALVPCTTAPWKNQWDGMASE